jgi:hypothetical protein
MIACGHENTPFGDPLCIHIRNCGTPSLKSVRWFTGDDLEAEILCISCADDREKGLPVNVEPVCEECFGDLTNEFADLVGCRGEPRIHIRPEIFNSTLKNSALPKEIGTVVDIAPINQETRSVWLMLAESGAIIRWDADTGDWLHLGAVDVPAEPEHEAWAGHVLRRRLHASGNGNFVAVVNDFGHYGQVVDLRSGKLTLAFDGGDYHSRTVPLSFAFAEAHGRVIAIHRTQWNRLDISDPATGELLTDRDPTGYQYGDPRCLDYFHGALSVSPGGAHIADNGWQWGPVGIPSAWNIDRWLSDNVWESEAGPTKVYMCQRAYYWNEAITWIDEKHIAVGGIGGDAIWMIDGVRIFDITQPVALNPSHPRSKFGARELKAFAGPAGDFFSDGTRLFSSDKTGLSRWDLADGARTGQIPNFQPTCHHRGANELIQMIDGAIVRWKIS